MPIDYPQVLERRTEGEGAWTNQETMLYALGVGMGADPMDEKELASSMSAISRRCRASPRWCARGR
jgi:hypothetical protein